MTASAAQVNVTVGEIPIRIHSGSELFAGMLHERYRGFTGHHSAHPPVDLDIELVDHTEMDPDHDLEVSRQGEVWRMVRGDFTATWDPRTRRGTVRQNPNPYSIDSVMRIIHSLEAVEAGGFLLHAASAIRAGRAYVFSGRSGAGKTTISRLAPADVSLLSDEISYVRPDREGVWRAWGTPFFGELARPGEDSSAPLEMACFLAKGVTNRLDRLAGPQTAARLLENILFFAKDRTLAARVLDNACAFATEVRGSMLTFRRDPTVWELFAHA